MFPHLASDDYTTVLDDVAYGLLAVAEVTSPPVDALLVAGRLGLVVARDDRQTGRARLARLADAEGDAQTAILLADDPRVERRQFAVAHELGEHLAHRVFERLGLDPRDSPPSARESVANHLAARIMLPTDWLAVAALACDWDLTRLKERFATASHELIARRMLDFSPAVVVTVFDQGRRTWRHANLYGRAPRLLPIEDRAWRLAHDAGLPTDIADAWGRVRVWPVHEPPWQREIIRYEPALDADDDSQLDCWMPADADEAFAAPPR